MSLRCASALVSYVTEQEAVNVSSDSTHKTNCSENMVRFGDVLTIENPSQTCWCVNIFIFLTLWTTKTQTITCWQSPPMHTDCLLSPGPVRPRGNLTVLRNSSVEEHSKRQRRTSELLASTNIFKRAAPLSYVKWHSGCACACVALWISPLLRNIFP